MAQSIKQVPTQNSLQYTLASGYSAGGTSLVLNQDASAVLQFPCVCVVDRINSSGVSTPTLRTYYHVTGASAATLTGVSLADGTDQVHAVGAIVEFVPDVKWAQSIYDGLSQVVVPATGVINKATGATINTGTSDTTIVTPKAIADSYLNPSGWIPAGTFTYASADAPTYVITVASGAASIYNVGDRIKLTDSTVKYFIITAVADTTLTVYGGTDYTLSGGAITLPYYSHQKAPLGFPLSPAKWTVEITDTTSRQRTTPSANTWYELDATGDGSGAKTPTISIPIGIWKLGYKVTGANNSASQTAFQLFTTLSTANNSESNNNLTYFSRWGQAGATNTNFYRNHIIDDIVTAASKTTYYLLGNPRDTVTTIIFASDINKLIIRAVCAYL
jgi:hypothetical protein